MLTLQAAYLDIKKNKHRSGETYPKVKYERDRFTASLEHTYDLANVDAVQIMEEAIKNCRPDQQKEKAALIEDLKFYNQQVKLRAGSMLRRDMKSKSVKSRKGLKSKNWSLKEN